MTSTNKPSDKKLNHGLKLDQSYLTLPETFYTKIPPTPVRKPSLILFNDELATSIGVEITQLTTQDKANLFSGNKLPKNTTPFAQAYAGHQFGHFTTLGDGRAHVLGEQQLANGDIVDIQLKGSGQTPYSRRGDGRAALGPMLREYIISEAMHSLGIPTTRSLAVVTTGEEIIRETILPGAILTRVASSHIRVGTFEWAAANQNKHHVESLLNYAINRHNPDIQTSKNKALDFLKYTMEKQINLVVGWMRVGFIHGVMNTDNMAISGETIDYGPCAFMDSYDPSTVFSSIDHMGRYAFANQPIITQWNLTRLAETLLPLIDCNIENAIGLAKETLERFTDHYNTNWQNMMKSKLGLLNSQPDDETLISDLLDWMKTNQADYTNTFRDLSQDQKPSQEIYHNKSFTQWYNRWEKRLQQNKSHLDKAKNLMKKVNPAIIPRNHNIENALDLANKGDLSHFHKLLEALKKPYEDNLNVVEFQKPPEPSDITYKTFCGT